MTSQADRTSSLGPSHERPDLGDQDAFAEMFDAHARHLFDYCCCLLGDRTRSTSATQVTLIAAHSLAGRLQDRDRMRAWLLALGRWECLSGNRGRARASAAGPPAAGDDLAEALAFVDAADDEVAEESPAELTLTDLQAARAYSVRSALAALPREDREVLDLIYRHDVSLAQLPAILGVPAARAPAMLAAARARFVKSAAGMDDAPATGQVGATAPGFDEVERLSAVPLADLPASVWRRTARVVMDPKFRSYRDAVSAHAEHLGPDGFPVQAEPAETPSRRKLLIASAVLAGLLLAPAALGAAGYAAFGGAAHAAAHGPRGSVAPVGPGSVSPPAGSGAAHSPGHHLKPGHSKATSKPRLTSPKPGTSASGKPKRSPSPSPTHKYTAPTSSPPSTSYPPPSPTPTPTPTPTTTPDPSPTATPT